MSAGITGCRLYSERSRHQSLFCTRNLQRRIQSRGALPKILSQVAGAHRGRDYCESRIPDSIKVYLATKPSERLDAEAVDNERLFHYRFAMDLPRPAREQVVGIKRKCELTDAECRWLRRSGQFRMTRDSAELVSDCWVPAARCFYSVVVMAFCGTGLLLIALSGAPPWKQALGVAVVAAFWVGAGWFINRMFLAPWRWLRRVGVR